MLTNNLQCVDHNLVDWLFENSGEDVPHLCAVIPEMILCRKTEVHRWQELFMEMTSRDLQANRAERESSFTLVYLGHADVLNYLLQNFRRVRIDQCNHLGFTALMKAAIQGRTRCAKLLLFAGTWQFTTYIYLG